MISPEFRAAVSEKNLLRTRIMLKDSFIVDPTFIQFDEMLSYAKVRIPGLIVPFDGDILEEDISKWNETVMNEELVQLVTNFSETRINHLKKVVAHVLKSEAEKIRQNRERQTQRQSCSSQTACHADKKSEIDRRAYIQAKAEARRNALTRIKSEAKRINRVMTEVEANNVWTSINIDETEQAARAILKAVQDFRRNK